MKGLLTDELKLDLWLSIIDLFYSFIILAIDLPGGGLGEMMGTSNISSTSDISAIFRLVCFDTIY